MQSEPLQPTKLNFIAKTNIWTLSEDETKTNYL
jgi:hypothetical protein